MNRLLNDNWLPQGLNEPWQGVVAGALQIKAESRPKSVQNWWETALQLEEEQLQREAERQLQETKAAQQRQQEQEERQRRQAEKKAREQAKERLQEAKRQRTSVILHRGGSTGVLLQLMVISILLLVAALLGLAWQKKLPISSSPGTTPSVSSSPDDSQGSIEEPRAIVTNRQQSFLTRSIPPTSINVPADSILLEVNPDDIASPNEPENQGDSWVYLRVCSVGKTSGQSKPLKLTKGQVVRIQSSQYKELKFPTATKTQKNQCQPTPSSRQL